MRRRSPADAAALGPVAQRIDNKAKGWRCLPPARVVKMVALEWLAPVFEYPHKLPVLEIRLKLAFRQVDETGAIERGPEQKTPGINDELAFDADVQLQASFFELPGVKAAVGGKAQINAALFGQVLRHFGL